ncbi:MAG: alpha/beta fold hydrolase [Muribaculaceae bacterium]|nr:alpha/beta fold hydrolase [Muribaculaceae bacterium]
MNKLSYDKTRCGIIFVHGIVGNLRIFDFLMPLLPGILTSGNSSPDNLTSGDYIVKSIILDGHGGNANDFSRTSMKRWKAQVEETVNDLSKQCDRIIGVGHSMGCLLLLDQASKDPISKLFLLNPPMVIRPKLGLFRNAFKVAIGQTKNDPVAAAAKDAYGVSLDFNPLHYYGWLQRYLELFAEVRKVREEALKDVKCPVRAFLSARDEMVSQLSGEVFNTLHDVKVTLLPSSTHYYYSPSDREIICREFSDVLRR